MSREIKITDKRLHAKYHRKFTRWRNCLDDLRNVRDDLGITTFTDEELHKLHVRFDRVYRDVRTKLNQLRVGFVRPRGRPRIDKTPVAMPVCGKRGCFNLAAPGQKYCSRECAPCGMYGYDTRPRQKIAE